MESLVGRTLGKYELTAMIGGGGMATVYEARHPGLDQRVAVKVLHPFLATDTSFVDRFRREAHAVASLRHPNIVRVLDSDFEGHLYYMVMEYVGGPTLSTVLSGRRSGGGLSLPEVYRIIPPLCSAVDYAAARGMVHRDIKPANIIMTEDGDPILTDYGIAKMMGATSLTSPGTVVGSAHYMSPEQAQGQECDVRSDLYSLGVVLFECLAGTVPFEGDTTVTVLIKHISAPVPSIRGLRPNLPLAVEPVLIRALAKLPRDRYESGALFAEELVVALTPSKSTAAVTEFVMATAPPPAATEFVAPMTPPPTPPPAPPPPPLVPAAAATEFVVPATPPLTPPPMAPPAAAAVATEFVAPTPPPPTPPPTPAPPPLVPAAAATEFVAPATPPPTPPPMAPPAAAAVATEFVAPTTPPPMAPPAAAATEFVPPTPPPPTQGADSTELWQMGAAAAAGAVAAGVAGPSGAAAAIPTPPPAAPPTEFVAPPPAAPPTEFVSPLSSTPLPSSTPQPLSTTPSPDYTVVEQAPIGATAFEASPTVEPPPAPVVPAWDPQPPVPPPDSSAWAGPPTPPQGTAPVGQYDYYAPAVPAEPFAGVPSAASVRGGGPPRRSNRTRIVVVAVLAAVLVAALGTAAALALRGGAADPTTTTLAVTTTGTTALVTTTVPATTTSLTTTTSAPTTTTVKPTTTTKKATVTTVKKSTSTTKRATTRTTTATTKRTTTTKATSPPDTIGPGDTNPPDTIGPG